MRILMNVKIPHEPFNSLVRYRTSDKNENLDLKAEKDK